jgi:hypothetical protein
VEKLNSSLVDIIIVEKDPACRVASMLRTYSLSLKEESTSAATEDIF